MTRETDIQAMKRTICRHESLIAALAMQVEELQDTCLPEMDEQGGVGKRDRNGM